MPATPTLKQLANLQKRRPRNARQEQSNSLLVVGDVFGKKKNSVPAYFTQDERMANFEDIRDEPTRAKKAISKNLPRVSDKHSAEKSRETKSSTMSSRGPRGDSPPVIEEVDNESMEEFKTQSIKKAHGLANYDSERRISKLQDHVP